MTIPADLPSHPALPLCIRKCILNYFIVLLIILFLRTRMQRRTNFNTLRADQNTDTYLSTMTNPAEHEIYDKTVHKAIK